MMDNRNCGRVVVVSAMLLACLPIAGLAQRGQTSPLSGVVRDGSGAPVGGVTVTVTSPRLIGGPAIATTNADGLFRLIELLPGEYAVRVEHAGFKTVTRAGVDLIAGGAVTLDWQLDIANTEETIEVHAASPMVDVRTAAVPNRLTAGMLERLPTTRNIPALANLTPGVVAEVPFGASANSFTTSIDGTPGSRRPTAATVCCRCTTRLKICR